MFGTVVPELLLSQAVICTSWIHNTVINRGLVLSGPIMAFLYGDFCGVACRFVGEDPGGVSAHGRPPAVNDARLGMPARKVADGVHGLTS